MKKFSLFLSVLTMLVVGLFIMPHTLVSAAEQPSMMDLIRESNYQVEEGDKPKSAVLIDANTGKLLWGENPDASHNPASIMKLMVIYLTYEAMEKGQFDMETKVTATPRHEQIANIYEISNNKIVAGVEYPIKELIPMALVPSSNVATMMLAELVEPDAVVFLQKMNQKAQELGMTNTKIVNATGAEISSFRGLYGIEGVDAAQLDQTGSNVTTARDFAIFTYHLLNNYPQILDYTSTPTVSTMVGTPYEETFTTYNYSVPGADPDERNTSINYHLEGVDGLKTGSSPSGAFNIDMTAKRGDLRLIAIVFGVGHWEDQTGEFRRHPFANAMLNYGFNHFEVKEILPAGEQVIGEEKITLKQPFIDVVNKEDNPKPIINESNELVLENPLPQVSDTIQPIKGDFETAEQAKKSAAKKDGETNLLDDVKDVMDMSHPIAKWIFILAGVILLFILILIIFLARDHKKRKRARQMRGERFK